MDLGLDENILKNKELYLQWFRKNFSKLKLRDDFKSHCRNYHNYLPQEERNKDLLLENVKLSNKIESLEKTGRRYKAFQELVAEEISCMKSLVEKLCITFRYDYRDKTRLVKDTLLKMKNIDHNNVDFKKSIIYCENELSLILEDKWVMTTFDDFKSETMEKLNSVLKKYVIDNEMSEINILVREKSKLYPRPTINNRTDGPFKKPGPPNKSRRSISINSSMGKTNTATINNPTPTRNLESDSVIDLDAPPLAQSTSNKHKIPMSCDVSIIKSDGIHPESNDPKIESFQDMEDLTKAKPLAQSTNRPKIMPKIINLSNITEVSEPSLDVPKPAPLTTTANRKGDKEVDPALVGFNKFQPRNEDFLNDHTLDVANFKPMAQSTVKRQIIPDFGQPLSQSTALSKAAPVSKSTAAPNEIKVTIERKTQRPFSEHSVFDPNDFNPMAQSTGKNKIPNLGGTTMNNTDKSKERKKNSGMNEERSIPSTPTSANQSTSIINKENIPHNHMK